MSELKAISEWNLSLASLLKEFTFDAGLPVIILIAACIFLWFCLFRKVVKLLFTCASIIIIFLCYHGTPEFLLKPLLSQDGINLQNQIQEKVKTNFIVQPFPKCFQKAEGIVILGSGVYQKGIPQIVAQARLVGLTNLLKFSGQEKKWIEKRIPIIFSGGVTNVNVAQSEAGAMKEFITYIYGTKINNYNLIAEEQSKNTYQNAVFAREIFDKHQFLKKIILITSSQHMFRANRVFLKQGFEVCPIPVATVEGIGTGFFNFGNAAKSVSILNEYFGVLGYTAKGWLEI